MQLNSRKINEPIKKWAKELDIFPKKIYRWLTNTWKDAQHHSLSEKCKSKPQWATISHWSEWLLSKNLQTINAGEGVEKREPSYTVGGNANWYSHYGEQWKFLKKLEIELSSIQFSSVAQSCLTLRPHELQHARPPGHHQLQESAQSYVHWVSDAIQPSHPLLSPFPSVLNLP